MRVLVSHEASGRVREAFRRRGHDAYSCDLRPDATGSPYHLQMDVEHVLYYPQRVLGGFPLWMRRVEWDLLIAHPTCTYLCSSGLHWNTRVDGRAAKTEAALAHVRALFAAPVPRLALENPVGRIGTAIRPANQVVQPYEFGDDASKATCLWLRGLPLLVTDTAKRVAGRRVEWPVGSGRFVERWANQTDSGQNRLGPSEDRWALRSVTYPGIAEAFAEQWGDATPTLLDVAEGGAR